MIVPASPARIAEAAARLRAGDVIAFPTETVYGLGADATNAAAVARIFSIKNRPSFDPLIVHLADAAALPTVAAACPEPARRLVARFWPGPLTVVLPKAERVPDIVTAGLSSVAVRVPGHDVARQLIAAAGCPIAAPSANPFGYVSPTTAEHVAAQLGSAVPIILDGGECRVGVESTIVSFLADVPLLLRPGAITLEMLEAELGTVAPRGRHTAADRTRTVAAPLRAAYPRDDHRRPGGGGARPNAWMRRCSAPCQSPTPPASRPSACCRRPATSRPPPPSCSPLCGRWTPAVFSASSPCASPSRASAGRSWIACDAPADAEPRQAVRHLCSVPQDRAPARPVPAG